ncbi:hypothetical protein M9H77_27582 [Catharanthus roseus]|uniref:Uncharacterized protein n=1 Tax=Catharanthus roseus TaxID=4058 RepID=A0ACC0ADT2_CATRO|nr:hypothetical protein M9H77_27582 [Catharanthus roseus]
MESEIRDLTSLLQEISTGLISNVREVRQLIKGVIHLVFLDDPCQPLSNPPPPPPSPETAVMKGRRKTNSTKMDKSHWEYVSIAHRKIGKSSGSGSGSVLVEEVGRLVVVEVGAEDVAVVGPCHSLSIMHFPSLCINLSKTGRMWLEMQLFCSVERVTELIMKTNWKEGSAPPEYWMDTPDHLYVIANTFNLCVVFLARSKSTTILPLLVDGCPLSSLQVQWEYHRDMRVKPLVAWRELSGYYSHWEYSWNSESSGECGGVKICNEPMPCGNPTITNILSPVRYPPNLISCHHIQSQANIQQFILILITDRRKHLDVGLASFGRMSKRGCEHGKIQIYPHLKYKI